MAALDLDLSGIALRIEGLAPDDEAWIRKRWSAFVTTAADPVFLSLSVRHTERKAPSGVFDPKAMTSSADETGAEFAMPEGRAFVNRAGEATIELARGLEQRELYTILNLLRACTAWRLPGRGALMLHAAGLVVNGRAYVLVGPEGCGKSTWTRLGEAAGCEAISDDIVLVDAGGQGPEVLGSPFRSTHEADYRPGRAPLTAVLLPKWGCGASWSPAHPLLSQARLVANLPFVADFAESDPRIGEAIERLVRGTPFLDLTYGPDAGFVGLLRRGPGATPDE